PHAGDVLHVLDQERQAGERSGVLAAGHPAVERPGLLERPLGAERDDGVQPRVVALDPRERELYELGRRHAALANGRRELGQHQRRRPETDSTSRPSRWSRRITLAAFRPGTPITPPPGCVPEPQRYRPATGER